MNKNLIKKIASAIIGIAVLFLVYVYFFGGDDDTVTTVVSEGEATELDQDIVELLLTLQSIDLSGAFLDSPLLANLIDFRVTLVEQPVGRTNPFAPVGTDANFQGAESVGNPFAGEEDETESEDQATSSDDTTTNSPEATE